MKSKPKNFITLKAMLPKHWCMWFYGDGTEKVFQSKELVETEIVLHVRKEKK